MNKAVLTLLLMDDLLYSRRPLVHQVPAPDATVKPRVDLTDVWINTVSATLNRRVLVVAI